MSFLFFKKGRKRRYVLKRNKLLKHIKKILPTKTKREELMYFRYNDDGSVAATNQEVAVIIEDFHSLSSPFNLDVFTLIPNTLDYPDLKKVLSQFREYKSKLKLNVTELKTAIARLDMSKDDLVCISVTKDKIILSDKDKTKESIQKAEVEGNTNTVYLNYSYLSNAIEFMEDTSVESGEEINIYIRTPHIPILFQTLDNKYLYSIAPIKPAA